MSKVNLSRMINTVTSQLAKHSPELLTGLGIAGMITATVLAVKATPKAIKKMDEEKDRRTQENIKAAEDSGSEEAAEVSKLDPIDIVKVTWKCYIPAIVTGVVSIACLIGASSVNANRNAALAAAYSLSETARMEYKDKVIETLGEKKEQEIRDKVAQDKVTNNPVRQSEVILTDRGDTLCYDAICGRYFRSDIDKIRQAVNELNKRLMSEMYISLNEFYYELGLLAVDIGEDVGWNVDDGLIDVDFSSTLAEDRTPCLVLDYRYAPRWDFRKLS